jgi:hypothetical protein
LTTALNTTGGIIEGLRVLFTLLDQDGEPIAREIANSPIDRIEQGGIMPVAAMFKVDGHEGVASYVEVLAALDSSGETSQYTEVQVVQTVSEAASDRSLWRVEGRVEVPSNSAFPVNSIRLLLIALDTQNAVVGYAVWEIEDEIAQGVSREFEVVVITFGPPIDHVELLSEARIKPGK